MRGERAPRAAACGGRFDFDCAIHEAKEAGRTLSPALLRETMAAAWRGRYGDALEEARRRRRRRRRPREKGGWGREGPGRGLGGRGGVRLGWQGGAKRRAGGPTRMRCTGRWALVGGRTGRPAGSEPREGGL